MADPKGQEPQGYTYIIKAVKAMEAMEAMEAMKKLITGQKTIFQLSIVNSSIKLSS